MNQSGFKDIKVSPRQVYVDDSNPDWVEGFTKNTFTAMIKGISEEAISKNLIGKKEFENLFLLILKNFLYIYPKHQTQHSQHLFLSNTLN